MGNLFNQSSSPLSTILPWTSPYIPPDFNNAFKIPEFNLARDLSTNPLVQVRNSPFDIRRLTDIQSSNSSTIHLTSNDIKGSNLNGWDAIGNISNGVESLVPDKKEYSGKYGNITQLMDNTYNAISDKVMTINPVVGGIMKLGSLASKGLNAIGGGTDSQTKMDAIFGSSLLSLTPIGLINGFFGKRTNSFTKDEEAFSLIGSAYTGTEYTINDTLLKSNKKYGLFSSKARRRANRLIQSASSDLDIISTIADLTQDYFNLSDSMAAINNNRYAFNMLGGYDLDLIRIGKSGFKIDTIERAKSILNKYNKLQTNLLLLGGTIDPFEYYLKSLPEAQRDFSNFRVRDYWVFNGKPKDFKEACRRNMFTLDKKGIYHARSVSENPETGEIEYMKASSHPTRYMESDWYEKGLIYNENDDGTISTIQLKPGVNGYDDWINFTNDYELVKSEPYWKYARRLKKEVPSRKDGGTFIEISVETSIELVDPMTIPEFLNGGPIDNSTIKSRTLAELIDYAKKVNPRFILRMSEPLKYVEWDDENGHHFGTHELGYTEIDGKYFIYPNILETSNGDLIRYPSDKWKEAVDNAYKNKNGLFFNTEEEAKLFTESGENPDGTFYGYKLGWPEFFKLDLINKHLKGGSINVIPDGALHARKHNMEMDGITKKGIPVVSQAEDGKIELQAEIERNEVILRLEVTLKLEELEKKFYSEESTLEEKDECALEAGKLLVYELLENTIDNTGLLNET